MTFKRRFVKTSLLRPHSRASVRVTARNISSGLRKRSKNRHAKNVSVKLSNCYLRANRDIGNTRRSNPSVATRSSFCLACDNLGDDRYPRASTQAQYPVLSTGNWHHERPVQSAGTGAWRVVADLGNAFTDQA